MVDQSTGIKCTGCTACYNACPVNAIKMKTDDEGFTYPIINSKVCIKCKKCDNVCPVINQVEDNSYKMPEVFAAWNRNEDIRINSTSGGIFSALAEYVLETGGFVVGAVYDNNFVIRHKTSHSLDDIKKLRQSKYAQSDMGTIFKDIEELLKNGEKVLFCGTPCQAAGLQKYLGKKYDLLYICDFICRGVISNKVYQKYLTDIAQENKKNIVRIQFKNKDWGWNLFSTKIYFTDETTYQKDRYSDPYLKGYLKHNLYLRPSCYECHFKSIPRTADISLGDFWGVGKYNSHLDTDKGTSVILVNSEKGVLLFNEINEKIYSEQRSLEEVLAGNSCLLNSAAKGEFREYFFENMSKIPFEKLIDKIDEKSLHLSIKDRILRFLHMTKIKLVNYIK